jgi:hypothetical protein
VDGLILSMVLGGKRLNSCYLLLFIPIKNLRLETFLICHQFFFFFLKLVLVYGKEGPGPI